MFSTLSETLPHSPDRGELEKPIISVVDLSLILEDESEPSVVATPTLSLLTQEWGQLTVSVHDLSHSQWKTNFVLGDGVLLIGRVSPDFIWNKIDAIKRKVCNLYPILGYF